jgi:DUF438 domain-containing protein
MNDYFYKQEASITVCDENGIVVYQNEKSKNTFQDVMGKSLYDCHPPHAIEKIKAMLQDGKPNSYTISKNGIKKLIYQTPWRDAAGIVKGLIEYSMVIPENMPHYVRGNS